jgi:transposase-like protein
MLAAEIRKRRINHCSYSNWRWHLDEVFVRINGETPYLWRAVAGTTIEPKIRISHLGDERVQCRSFGM